MGERSRRSDSKRKFRTYVIVACVLAVAFCILWNVNDIMEWSWELVGTHDRHSMGHVEVGMQRQAVIAKLGSPFTVARSNADLAEWGGNFEPVPTAPVTNEVLMYKSTFWMMYVYIGPDGRVSHVFYART